MTSDDFSVSFHALQFQFFRIARGPALHSHLGRSSRHLLRHPGHPALDLQENLCVMKVSRNNSNSTECSEWPSDVPKFCHHQDLLPADLTPHNPCHTCDSTTSFWFLTKPHSISQSHRAKKPDTKIHIIVGPGNDTKFAKDRV